ncbi:MAG: alpha/beta fold hydrolase [Deltaproteobacteria bacterium]|nr:alpha/beta fold hydrolase [Deltaproteobacteria bacterium]
MPEWIDLARRGGRMRVDRRPCEADDRPALLLIGGMTQTLASWGAHLRPLSERRETIVYEARGQGMTELPLDDCSLPQQVEDFAALVDALGLRTPVDLCGFSFGGRVALAIAAAAPALLRRVAICGVGLDRSVVARLVVQGWIAALATGDLEALARVSLPDILGPAYLARHAGSIEAMVRASIERNRYDGVLALMRQTQQLADDSPWTTAALAERAGAAGVDALCIGGALDRLAAPADVRALAERLHADAIIIDDVGHTVAIEAPQPWRAALEGFLDR